jgi:hypothetical protein
MEQLRAKDTKEIIPVEFKGLSYTLRYIREGGKNCQQSRTFLYERVLRNLFAD